MGLLYLGPFYELLGWVLCARPAFGLLVHVLLGVFYMCHTCISFEV